MNRLSMSDGFPIEFMFRLRDKGFEVLRPQFATSKEDYNEKYFQQTNVTVMVTFVIFV